MKKLFLIILVLGAIAPNTTLCQSNNSIMLQSGLFHNFFDGSPMMNTKYANEELGVFNGQLYNSVGLLYARRLNSKNSISFGYLYYSEYYWNVYPNLLKNVVTKRNYNTFNVTYERNLFFNQSFSLTYGSGINYRNGSESVVVNYGYIPSLNSYESLLEVREINDIGINLRTGFEYSPLKWLTLYTKLDLIGFAYLNDKKAIERLQDPNSYNYKEYPHRFDLSWNFGIGFNFGK